LVEVAVKAVTLEAVLSSPISNSALGPHTKCPQKSGRKKKKFSEDAEVN
jgi:hypothetical protein